ncbi:response regulator transcription factor [Streptomyces virginiae]|nr:response regulator transcription factor [Streptomyces sp. SID1046]MCX5272644.1 response regulator transcription factor [Streptomyces virginiae]MYV79011.1 response regulator [Streptomyces sp. SID1046]
MVRVMIVDDEVLLRSCMQRILESEPDIDVPVACDGPAALEAIEAHRPDVVLLDLRMPEVDGFAVLAGLGALADPPAVAILTTFLADEDIAAALGSGARGFLLKDATPQELVHAVRVLASGGTVLSPQAARIVVDGYLGSGPGHNELDPRLETRLDSLTEREHQVLDLLAEGLTNADIGRRLLLSASTTKEYVSAILAKLGLANRVQAAVVAHRAASAPGQSRPPALAGTR